VPWRVRLPVSEGNAVDHIAGCPPFVGSTHRKVAHWSCGGRTPLRFDQNTVQIRRGGVTGVGVPVEVAVEVEVEDY
jgi:hypothetical protein